MLPQNSRTLLIPIMLIIWVLFVLHVTALHYHLYWIFSWFDSVMHLLGGLWLGLSSFWIFTYSGYVPRFLRTISPVLMALLAGILFALFWEYFELIVQNTTGVLFEGNWLIDTITDLFCGIFGMSLGTLWGKYKTQTAAGISQGAVVE